MRIGVIVAMEKEFVQLTSLVDGQRTEHDGRQTFVVGTICRHEIIMMQSGIGKVNAALGAQKLIERYSPELVISTGVAGGADISMEVTETVVSTACVYHDAYCGSECAFGQILGLPARFQSPKEYVEKALSLNADNTRNTIHAGLIVTGDWFVDSREKMTSILNRFPEAKAVDMESGAIAQTCYVHDVPFISFRIISDIPLKDNKASQYFDFWARIADGSFAVTRRFLMAL